MDGTQGDSVFRMTAYNQFRALFLHLFGTLMMIIVLYILNFEKDFITIFLISWIIYTIPVLYLHVEYWIRSWDVKYKIKEGVIIQYKKNEKEVYNAEDILKIILYKSASIDKGGIPILAMESYHYARVIMRTGDELIITCLLTPKVDKAIQKLGRVTIQRKKRGFCPIFWR